VYIHNHRRFSEQRKKFALERQAAQSISVFIHHRSKRKIIYRTVNNVKHSVTRHTSLAMLKMPPGPAGNLDKESLLLVKIISRNATSSSLQSEIYLQFAN
jgi:hypothetical protein